MIRAAGAIMAGKDISVKKYVVRLSVEEREQLETLIRKGKGPARRLLKARILLKADISDAGDGWSDNKSRAVGNRAALLEMARVWHHLAQERERQPAQQQQQQCEEPD